MISIEPVKNEVNKTKFLKSLFEIYNNYQFKITNKELMEKSNIIISNSEIDKMKDFINLIDQAIKFLDNEEQEIIRISFIDKIHYSKCNWSQSCFFVKRKKTSFKLYDLIFSQCKNFELNNIINCLKNN